MIQCCYEREKETKYYRRWCNIFIVVIVFQWIVGVSLDSRADRLAYRVKTLEGVNTDLAKQVEAFKATFQVEDGK